MESTTVLDMPKIALYTISAEEYTRRLVDILKRAGKGKKVIYLTTTKPYSQISGMLHEAGIKQDNIFFIDCVSRSMGEKSLNAQNCVFLENPRNLTAISIAINESVKKLPGKKLLVMDSLSTLMLYNDHVTMGRFSNFVINRMRALDVDTVLSAFEADANSDVLKQIAGFVDEVKKK
ncbi:Uncharacterised protein [Candidatus Anstonella stagnisolia]|nr:Uncharacterised protein [Candidatus Anstonella stagnisolia]